MTTDRLKKAQAILAEFNKQLVEKQRIYDGFHLVGDHQDNLREDFLTKELAYSWIYAATDHYLIEPEEVIDTSLCKHEETIDLISCSPDSPTVFAADLEAIPESWTHDDNPMAPEDTQQFPSTLLQNAAKFYDTWMSKELDIQIFPDYIIPPADQNESLKAYLTRLWMDIIANQKPKTTWWKSLRQIHTFSSE